MEEKYHYVPTVPSVLPPKPYEWKPKPSLDEIPEKWKKTVPPQAIRIALEDEHVLLGWTLEDYLYYAAKFGKYELVGLWGVQGSGKSDDMLRMLFWIYGDWDEVLRHIVYKPRDFVKILRETPMGKRIPGLGWDDIITHFPSSTFKTDISTYEAIDSSFATIRVKASVIITTLPVIDRLAKALRDNLTFEVYLGRNQNERIFRLFRLPNFYQVKSNLFKIMIEEPKPFDLLVVPTDVYREYENDRLTLTEEALENLDRTVEPETLPEGHLHVMDAAEMCMEHDVKYGTGTIQQDHSRGVIRGMKHGGLLYVLEEDIRRQMKIKGYRRK